MRIFSLFIIAIFGLLAFNSCEKEQFEPTTDDSFFLQGATRELTMEDLLCQENEAHACFEAYTGALKQGFIGQEAVWFEEVDGFQLVDGDIIMPENVIQSEKTELDFRGATLPGLRLWPNGRVYYQFAGNLPYQLRRSFQEAAKIWTYFTGVQFIQRTSQSNYIYVFRGNGNYSSLGMIGGRQELSLNDDNIGVAIHELGHALGLIHEHQRGDRDRHIRLNRAMYGDHNFARFWNSRNYGSFDWGSIMLYQSAQLPNGQWNMVNAQNGRPFWNSVEYWKYHNRFALPSQQDIDFIKYLY